MKYEVVEWFGLGLVCAWVWVQTLLRTKLLFFCQIFWCMNVEGLET